ncbi:MAG TPA: DUF3108 domain-containing protein [Pyrinomonadaceae bacterium]
MRRTRLTNALALFALSLLLAAHAPAQQTPAPALSSPAPRLPVGEKLTYTVSYSNFANAAHVEVYVAGRGPYFNREGVELRAHVATVGEVRAALLALDNYYFTYVDPQSGIPYRAQTTAGAPPPPDVPDVMDTAARTQDVTTVASPAGAETVSPVHDLISALFSLRALPLATGSTFPFTAQFQGTQYEAELRVTGRETVKTPAGSFDALASQVRVRKNREADDLRLNVYFTDDSRHVPVLFTARLRTGALRAALVSDDAITTAAPAQPATQIAAQPTPTPRLTADPARGDGAAGRAAPPSGPPAAGSAAGTAGDLPFNVGEQLSFNFFLGNAAQPVGSAVLTVRSRGRYFNREGFLISATMSTAAPVDQVFSVRDNVVTYVSATTLLPFRNELQQQEGAHRVQGVVSFDQERGSALAADGKSIEIPVGTYDFVSVLYAMRSFDLAPPKRNAVSLLINKRPRTLFITSVSRDTIDLGGQRIGAYQLALATDEAQGDRFKLRLWIGSDRRRLPLRLTAVTPLGLVRADLSIIPYTRQ